MTKSFVTIADLSKEKIMSLLEAAARFEANPNRKTLDGRVIATLFFVIGYYICKVYVSCY